MEEINRLQYRVGGLLYTPASNKKAADRIKAGAYPSLTSMVFCLEDTIPDDALEEAERTLKETLLKLCDMDRDKRPLIFVRVRSPRHMERIFSMYADMSEAVTGYVLPKFDLSNAEEYIRLVTRLNAGRQNTVYMMPILESKSIADIMTRRDTLWKLKKLLDTVREYVLNVRVGGNDFCNLYGLRRSVTQNIYDIGVIRDILMDIINIYASDYVVSGPVWEYFGNDTDDAWALGLRHELELDRLNGFFGKTAIHPSQLPLIYESLKVTEADYLDARKILNWTDTELGVAKSESGSRMNEVKCHGKWAEKIVMQKEIYGVRE